MSRVSPYAPVMGSVLLFMLPLLSRLALADAVPPARLPHALFSSDSHDAGDVWRGDLVHYRFSVRNSGNAPLQISARPRCGCTAVAPTAPIAAGAEGVIEAAINTGALRGRIAKDIDLTTNDPTLPRTVLHLSANVLSIVQVRPGESGLLELVGNAPGTKEFDILVREGAEVTGVSTNVAYASAKTEPIPTAEAETRMYRLLVTISPTAPFGRSLVTVDIGTNSTREAMMKVYVICERGIVVAPVFMHFAVVSPTMVQPNSQSLVIGKRSGAFRVLSATCEDPRVAVSIEAIREDHEYRVLATYKGGWPVGPVSTRVVITTSDPDQAVLDVPVTATVRAATP